jgi:hypothetical protein
MHYPSAKRSNKNGGLHFAKFARDLQCSFMAILHRMAGRKVSNIAVIKLKWTDWSSTHTGESGNVYIMSVEQIFTKLQKILSWRMKN